MTKRDGLISNDNMETSDQHSSKQTLTRLHVIHFVICSVGVFFNSFAFSFNVIGESVKIVFSLSQSEVELVSSMYFMGTGLNLIPGYFYDKNGARQTAVRGVALTVVSWLLITAVCRAPDLFTGRYVALSVMFLVAGHGKSFVLLPMMVSGLNSFSTQHRGKAIAFLATLYTVGPLVAVYSFQFMLSNSNGLNDKTTSLSKVIFSLGTILATVGIMFSCSPYHGIVGDRESSRRTNQDNKKSNGQIIHTYFTLLSQRDVILCGSSFALILGVAITFETNIPFFTESLKLPSYSTPLIVIHRFCQGMSRLVMGYFIDSIDSMITRLWICASFALVSVTGLVYWVRSLTEISHIIIASLSTGLARGVLGLINVLACENYDLINHGKIYGLADTFLSLAILILQEAFGLLYVSAISGDDGTVCYGEKCLRKTVVFLAVVCCVGTGSTAFAARKPSKRQTQCP